MFLSNDVKFGIIILFTHSLTSLIVQHVHGHLHENITQGLSILTYDEDKGAQVVCRKLPQTCSFLLLARACAKAETWRNSLEDKTPQPPTQENQILSEVSSITKIKQINCICCYAAQISRMNTSIDRSEKCSSTPLHQPASGHASARNKSYIQASVMCPDFGKCNHMHANAYIHAHSEYHSSPYT